MSNPTPDEQTRRRISFVEALGKGGFGSVYLADVQSRKNFVQRIAIKILNEELRGNEDVVGRQRDEARLLAQLNHDNIVKVFDLIEIDGRPAVFMEYVPGVDMGRLLTQGPLPPRAALEIALAAASGLHAAWSTLSPVTGRPLQVIHRDIKPSNLLLSEHGTLKILDFGIARADFDREGQTLSVQFGTARYMAPEQWLNEELTPAVDVFALGITLIELLKGGGASRLPLREDKYKAGRDGHIQGIRDPVWGAVWWRKLEALLQGMLAREPDDRPSAEAVHERCLELSDEIGGESLRRFARRQVPPLVQERRLKMRDASILPSADLLFTSEDPSILTDGKTIGPALGGPVFPWATRGMAQQLVLALAFVLALWWFLTG
jgi:serine/threonine protein kinase